MARISETFGRLLTAAVKAIGAIENKTEQALQDELGELLGYTRATVARREAGHLPSDVRETEVFAEAGVNRGLLSRVWLTRLLEAARYPDAERLIAKLCPPPAATVPTQRTIENLPAPPFSRFIMRRDVYEQVIEGLAQRSAVVAIIGMGGMGKSSLALEVAKQVLCRDGQPHEDGRPAFTAAVWVSDRDRPGSTRLGHVLDEIARVLDRPGYTSLDPRPKQIQVEHLLRSQSVLLVLDNADTIADPALLQWLLRLPEPSKALVTTRGYQPEFRRGVWLIELDGMSRDEVAELVAQAALQLKLPQRAAGAGEVSELLSHAPVVAHGRSSWCWAWPSFSGAPPPTCSPVWTMAGASCSKISTARAGAPSAMMAGWPCWR